MEQTNNITVTEEEPKLKGCIKCMILKTPDNYKNKWRPNICIPCLKQDASTKYLKARVTKDMCTIDTNKEKWTKLKCKRDKKRDEIGKYTCDVCTKTVALKD